MIYELISVDNETSVGQHYLGRIGGLEVLDGVFYFKDLRSSPIKTDTEKDGVRTIQTRNTKYVFTTAKLEYRRT